MPKYEKQRIKILRLYEFLLRESSEKVPKSMSQIIKYLEKEGIHSERKSIYEDIKIINEYYKGKDGNGIIRGGGPYYVSEVDRKLGYDGIRFLLDAVQSASFLTVEQTKELSYAIKQLAGSRQQDNWNKNVISLNRTKHTNDQVLRSVGVIDEAISLGKKVQFKYYNLGLDGKLVYKKDGAKYTESPISLIFNNGYYYMICYSKYYKDICNYRLDRMEYVVISEEDSNIAKEKEEFEKFEKKHLLTAFNMWSSKKTAMVTLLVDNCLIGDIFDKFGMRCRLKPQGESKFTVSVRVPLNDQFYGWVTSFGPLMEILFPKSARIELKEILDETAKKYEDLEGKSNAPTEKPTE